ncbi:methyltransferase domain-containing protein [Pseudodesulfovibrio sp. F-1]|uniref:Methyltransferase domain-containing protein n=1 Tax=Pseudodesulfovibrio alkaliphilus TaxID=2661613 RepID=A0A7K1KPF5_9BACT|nr:methyltransferase domain-containing protein [Pseudodesulfovibrio alkaliphilus]
MKYLLHVGSGPKNPDKIPGPYKGDGWREIRLDLNPDTRPDIVGDIRNMPEVESARFDAVYSSHNLEHLYPHEVPLALAEFHRVLMPGGHALVTCPDIQTIAAFIAKGNLLDPIYSSPAGPIAPLDILYGHRPSLERGNLFMAHHTAFTSQTLAQAMSAVGFVDIRVQRRGAPYFDLWAQGFRTPATEA